MVTSLNVDTALLQEAIELTGETAIETLCDRLVRSLKLSYQIPGDIAQADN